MKKGLNDMNTSVRTEHLSQWMRAVNLYTVRWLANARFSVVPTTRMHGHGAA